LRCAFRGTAPDPANGGMVTAVATANHSPFCLDIDVPLLVPAARLIKVCVHDIFSTVGLLALSQLSENSQNIHFESPRNTPWLNFSFLVSID
jgi:hypothetical protein